MQHDNPWPTTIATFIVVIVLVVPAWIFWGSALFKSEYFDQVPKPARPAAGRWAMPAWFWWILILGCCIAFWQSRPERPALDPAPGPTPRVTAVIIAVFLGVVLLRFLLKREITRVRHAGVRRACKRADAGDLDGAIEDLRKQLEVEGPAQDRANALGLLLLRGERWDEAAAMFRKGEQLDGVNWMCWTNLAKALRKGGKPEEALTVLRDVVAAGSQGPGLDCFVALEASLALAALGRWNEARERLCAADAAARALPRSQRALIGKEIEECRQSLEKGSGAMQKPEGLEEL